MSDMRRAGRVLVGLLLLVGVVALPVLVEAARLPYLVVVYLVVPGAGWAYRWGAGDLGDRLALAVAISMSATILVTTAMVATGTWSLPGGLAALALVTIVGLVPFPGPDRGDDRGRDQGRDRPRERRGVRVRRGSAPTR